MQQARMIGYRVQQYAKDKKIPVTDLCSSVGCSEDQMNLFLCGRAYLSFDRLSSLAKALGVGVSSLLSGCEESYDKSVVHCMNDFTDSNNREQILDYIDDYMDILDSLS